MIILAVLLAICCVSGWVAFFSLFFWVNGRVTRLEFDSVRIDEDVDELWNRVFPDTDNAVAECENVVPIRPAS